MFSFLNKETCYQLTCTQQTGPGNRGCRLDQQHLLSLTQNRFILVQSVTFKCVLRVCISLSNKHNGMASIKTNTQNLGVALQGLENLWNPKVPYMLVVIGYHDFLCNHQHIILHSCLEETEFHVKRRKNERMNELTKLHEINMINRKTKQAHFLQL